MKSHVSTNYGLLGGTLDATKHVEAAILRLLNETEAKCVRCEFTNAVTAERLRGKPGMN